MRWTILMIRIEFMVHSYRIIICKDCYLHYHFDHKFHPYLYHHSCQYPTDTCNCTHQQQQWQHQQRVRMFQVLGEVGFNHRTCLAFYLRLIHYYVFLIICKTPLRRNAWIPCCALVCVGWTVVGTIFYKLLRDMVPKYQITSSHSRFPLTTVGLNVFSSRAWSPNQSCIEYNNKTFLYFFVQVSNVQLLSSPFILFFKFLIQIFFITYFFCVACCFPIFLMEYYVIPGSTWLVLEYLLWVRLSTSSHRLQVSGR
jgi:hypothetical protein